MKTSAALLALFLLLAGCSHEPVFVWASDSRGATISQSEGMAISFREYTFDVSTRKLSGHWIERGPSGTSDLKDEVVLSEEQSAHLVELLAHVRLDTTNPSDCWNDIDTVDLELVEASGETRLFRTEPEKNNCDPSSTFVVKEDLLAVLDACAALLPTPSR